MSDRVLLVAPEVAREAGFPLGLASLAGALRAAGAECVGLDLRLDAGGLARLGAPVPPFAVVDTSIRNVGAVRRLVGELRRCGVARVAVVGTAAAVAPGLFVGPGGADAAVTGDPEAVVPALLAAVEAVRPVPGAWIRDAAGRVRRASGGLLPAAGLPAPDREVFPLLGYAAHALRAGRRYAAIAGSRGCPFACTFCPVPRRPGGHRVRPVEAVLDEMAAVAATAGVTGFFLEDEQPLADRAWFAALLEGVRRRLPGAVIELPNGVRADLLDAELLDDMAASGVRRLAVGVESGSERVRRELGRPVATARLLEVIATARGRGLVVTGYFMIGLPGETRRDLLATLVAAARLPFHYAHVSVYWPWDPPVEGATAAQRRLAAPRLLGYLGAYASPVRLVSLAATGDLSAATLPHAARRLGRWLAAGVRGGGGW